ncbi:MAG: hypothetical protein ACRC49_02120 [Plesiomonas sp.]
MMKLRVELDLTPQELAELTENHQAIWQKLQMQFWSQMSEQAMKMSPLGSFYSPQNNPFAGTGNPFAAAGNPFATQDQGSDKEPKGS